MSKITTDFAAAISKNHILLGVVFVVSFTIVYLIVKHTCDFAFYTIAPLRRILLGRAHIEGKWVEHVRRNGVCYSIGIVQFTPGEYSFQLSGVNYDPTGVQLNDFSASVSSMNWPSVNFQHGNNDSRKKSDPAVGVGFVTFIDDAPSPRKYTAHYNHNTSTDGYSVEARRITAEEDIDDVCDPARLPTFIRREWAIFSAS
jgi:hypothetical protein